MGDLKDVRVRTSSMTSVGLGAGWGLKGTPRPTRSIYSVPVRGPARRSVPEGTGWETETDRVGKRSLITG